MTHRAWHLVRIELAWLRLCQWTGKWSASGSRTGRLHYARMCCRVVVPRHARIHLRMRRRRHWRRSSRELTPTRHIGRCSGHRCTLACKASWCLRVGRCSKTHVRHRLRARIDRWEGRWWHARLAHWRWTHGEVLSWSLRTGRHRRRCTAEMLRR